MSRETLNRRKIGIMPVLLAVLVVLYVLFYLPTPYVVYKPGTAEEIKPMIQVEQGDPVEKGTFMLTTVRMNYANTVQYITALLNPYQDTYKKSDLLREGETKQEYSERQAYVMQTSQSNAIQAAYTEAGIDYKMVTKSVIVLETTEGLPAEKVLLPGDVLLSIDGNKISNVNTLLKVIKGKKVGDSITLTYLRGKEEKTAAIQTVTSPVKPGEKQEAAHPVIGVVPAELQTVQTKDGKHEVKIKAGEIGGPSAGFIFSMAILNQLTEGDLTKGYRIAGTGTITPQGTIGVIGGIKHKIIAADKEEADIFFAPKDYIPKSGEKGQPVLNTTEAQERAKKIRTDMLVISVGTIDEAIAYLAKLPPKS